MIPMNKSIDKVKTEIFRHLESEKEFIIFDGRLGLSEDGIDLIKRCHWNKTNNFRGFFNVAKFVGVKVIYFDEIYGSQIKEEILNDEDNGENIVEINFEFLYGDIFHTLTVRSNRLQDALKIMNNSDIDNEFEGVSNEIPEETLCKSCKKNRRQFDDKDYCSECIEKLRKEADECMDKLAKTLASDSEFKGLPNENARVIYVKKKYKDEKGKNKFIYFKKLAKDAYAVLKMQKLNCAP